jgi:hypothetical protein
MLVGSGAEPRARAIKPQGMFINCAQDVAPLEPASTCPYVRRHQAGPLWQLTRAVMSDWTSSEAA